MNRPDGEPSPWPALWALVIGFFMILVDSTIVSVATPAIMSALGADVTRVMWVTSAYLLAYAVPLLITGRLGDRFGPRRVYLTGLTLFTVASLACGLAGTVDQLVWARVAQGLGAAMMTPQTMAVITRTFPPYRRGSAMALWGATAGVATLVGPLLGGVLVDSVGWEWIFFVNVPVGVLGFVLAYRLVPRLETHAHSFDLLGLVLSGASLFLLVFGVQEGAKYDWGTITGPISVWSLIIVGAVLMVVFLGWQAVTKSEPLVPLTLFRDRNFTLANVSITMVGFAITAMVFPIMLWAQTARGLSPTQAALLLAPMAVLSGLSAPVVGRLINVVHPRILASTGLGLTALGLVWTGAAFSGDGSVLWVLAPSALLGLASAFIWGPLAITATRNLPMRYAGAGSGVYNTTRQLGAVLGSAAIASLIEGRMAALLPGQGGMASPEFGGGHLPPFLRDAFSTAMEQSLWLPAATLAVGVLATVCFAGFSDRAAPEPDAPRA